MLTGSSSLPAVPHQGTVLVDLLPEDQEYISVDEQVRYSSIFLAEILTNLVNLNTKYGGKY